MAKSEPDYEAAPGVVMKMSECLGGQSFSTAGFCLATLTGLWLHNYAPEKRAQAWAAFAARVTETRESFDSEPLDPSIITGTLQ